MSRRGATLLELLTVVAFLGLLSGIAVPGYRRLRDRAVAAEAIGAMHVVRNAAYAHVEATGSWPDGAAMGDVPAALAPFLPAGFGFSRPGYDLAWRRASWSDGSQAATSQMMQLAVNDPAVCTAINRLLGGSGNSDLLSSCDGRTGLVTVFLDS